MDKWRFATISILFLFVFTLSGCGTKCCLSLETPSIDWPVVSAQEAPTEKTKEPAPEPKKKIEPEVKAAPPKPVEPPIESIVETPVEPKTEKPIEPAPVKTDFLEPPIEPKPPTEPPLDTEILFEEKKVNLESSLQGEKEGMVGIVHAVKCQIVNKGEKTAESYRLKITLPPGLKFENSPESVQTNDFQKLDAVQPKIHEFKFIAELMGTYAIKAEVLYEGAVVHTSLFNLEVKDKPKMSLTIEGPQKVNMESQHEYTITLKNIGKIPLTNIVVDDKLQDKVLGKEEQLGFIFISSTPEGVYDDEKGWVTWKIGDLNPDQEKNIKFKVTAIEKGIFLNKVRAKDEKSLVKEKAQIEIEVVGAIGLQLNQFDSTDPVEVGEKTTYVLEMSNQGYKDATNVKVIYFASGEATFVEANVEGTDIPLTYKQEGEKIVFDAIDFLKPASKVIFRITVKTNKEGDLLHTVEIQSNEFTKPLTKNEGTKVFRSK